MMSHIILSNFFKYCNWHYSQYKYIEIMSSAGFSNENLVFLPNLMTAIYCHDCLSFLNMLFGWGYYPKFIS